MDKYLFLSEMKKAGYKSQKSFAKKLGISEKVLSNHLNGITKVSTEEAARYCEALNIRDETKVIQIFLSRVSLNRDYMR